MKCNEKIYLIEEAVDRWMEEILNKKIPRYKYIYHINLAFIKFNVKSGSFLSVIEKDLIFSLTYNTYLAYNLLEEEDVFDYTFDENLYDICFKMLLLGYQYAKLCEIFPLLHSNKAKINYNEAENLIKFEFDEVKCKTIDFINNHRIRKALGYQLQFTVGERGNLSIDECADELVSAYLNFFNENMQKSDFDKYSYEDWFSLTYFLLNCSMTRFVKLYRDDFMFDNISASQFMIIFSPGREKDIKEIIGIKDDETFNCLLQEYMYKPLGNNYVPKLDISDAPLIKTKDGYILINPMTLLYNDSMETRLLNYLRKTDTRRYGIIKDKIKERSIPELVEMFKYKFPHCKVITNFNVKIPNSKKNERELDLLVIDENGDVLYLEIKHFYNPISASQKKVIDKEFNLSLEKIPNQIEAIILNWSDIQKVYNIDTEIKEINGAIVSYQYMGYDISKNEDYPIIDLSLLYENISEASNLKQVFDGCKETIELLSKIKMVKNEVDFQYAGYKFQILQEVLDPQFESLFRTSFSRNVYQAMKIRELNKDKRYDSMKEAAIELISRIEQVISYN